MRSDSDVKVLWGKSPLPRLPFNNYVKALRTISRGVNTPRFAFEDKSEPYPGPHHCRSLSVRGVIVIPGLSFMDSEHVPDALPEQQSKQKKHRKSPSGSLETWYCSFSHRKECLYFRVGELNARNRPLTPADEVSMTSVILPSSPMTLVLM